MTEAERAYIAGFIDGEGTINVLITKKGKFVVQLQCGQVDPRPLKFLQSKLGGSLYLTKNHIRRSNSQPFWQWAVAGKKFDTAISEIYPFLINKKEKASIAMEMRKFMSKKNTNGKGLTEEQLVKRLELVHAAKEQSL